MHKRVLGVIVFVAAIFATPVAALNPPVVDPNIELDAGAPVLVSSVHLAPGASFVELHNQSQVPINLGSWTLRFSSAHSDFDINLPDGWLLADNYVVLSENSSVAGTLGYSGLALDSGETIQTVELINNASSHYSQLQAMPADVSTKWYQRKSTGASGVFASDFSAATASTKLRHTPLYYLPAQRPLLRIVEIYAHAPDCAPTNSDYLCGDYVKLHNPTNESLDIGDYRVRSDSSTSESSNAFHLDSYASVPPGGFVMIHLRDDSDRLSLTDGGGYVWLEDAEGIEVYDETIIQYPSFGSDSKIGWVWALADDDTWQWSNSPQPNQPNVISVEAGMGAGSDSAACPAGKYRNPETNRCRTVEEAINSLAVCDEGEYRSLETNRCRKIASLATATLAPCEAGEVRNPETNRCRKVAEDSSSLKPCDPGEERNPDTNRCKKVAGVSTAAITDPPKKQGIDAYGGLALGLVGLVAVGYGAYEWRSEIAGAFGRMLAALGKK